MRRRFKYLIILSLPIMVIGTAVSYLGNKQDSSVSEGNLQQLSSKLSCKGCNVIIISVEPLRAKSLSIYGYTLNTTPNLDKLSKESLVFDNYVSVAPWTLPAHMSLLTGLYPSRHKITNKMGIGENGVEYENSLDIVSPEIETLAQLLKMEGYATAGFTGGAADSADFGFDKGFDVYVDDGDFVGLENNIDDALEWVRDNESKNFLVFLQGYDVHGQYVPEGGYNYKYLDFDYEGSLTGSKEEQKDLREEGITRGKIFLGSEDVKYLNAIYDEKIERMDEKVGWFLEEFKSSGLWDKTIIIFTSGHGEEIYEHGRVDHGHSLYEELIHVPLLIKVPGNSEEIRVSQQYSGVDILPTILDLLELKLDQDKEYEGDGRSIFESLGNKGNEQYVFLETDYRYAVFKRGVRTGDGWKMIKDLETGEVQMFNLADDKEEQNNVVEKYPEKLKELDEILDRQLKEY